jgi:glycosyltransferase involved in cell wall biosynthesis
MSKNKHSKSNTKPSKKSPKIEATNVDPEVTRVEQISSIDETNLPFVSICTPTFNRRPFIPMMIQCFQHQTYPKDKIEWIIIDDGTDKIGDLVKHIPQVKYVEYKEKMYLGKKRNIMHDKCKGDIIIYMDDDDYYPPERISHAVETLMKNPQALCAGSSEMYIYFKDLYKMYQFGPYGPNHSTAATFAFRKELLSQTRYEDNAALAEETYFLKKYTIPFVQLDPMKTILVFSHVHNSMNKKELLVNPAASKVTLSDKSVDDFIKEPFCKNFFMNEIDDLLSKYDAGKIENKPEVIQQMGEIKEKREKMVKDMQLLKQLQEQYKHLVAVPQDTQQKIAEYEKKLMDQSIFIQEILKENGITTDLYKEFPLSLEELVFKRKNNKEAEIKQFAVLPLECSQISKEFLKDLQMALEIYTIGM